MNTSFLDDIFTISHNGKDVIERKSSDNKILWERAILKTTDKGARISLTNTRKTGGDGVTYPVFTPSQVLSSVVAYGKCTQSGTPTPTVPADIVCNNGVLRYGKLVAITSGKIGAWINGSGAWATDANSYCVLIPVEVGKSYAIKWSTTDSEIIGGIFRYGFTATSTPQSQVLSQVERTSPQELSSVVLTADYSYLVIQVANSFGDSIVANGYLTISEQVVYAEGAPEIITVAGGEAPKTASVTDLFAVGDYTNTQDIMTGTITRQVNIVALDGTENWKSGNNTGLYYLSLTGKKSEKSPLMSTHFTYSSASSTQIVHGEMMCGGASANTYFRNTDCATLEDWQTWLAAQYAAGTPVIVVYPLATPQTEQVTPSSQQIALNRKDTYTLSTSGSVSDLLIQATYLGR